MKNNFFFSCCMCIGISMTLPLGVHAASVKQVYPGSVIEIPANLLRLRLSQVVKVISSNERDGSAEVRTFSGKKLLLNQREILGALPWRRVDTPPLFHADELYWISLVTSQFEAPKNSRFRGKIAYVVKGLPGEYFFVSSPERFHTFGFSELEARVKNRMDLEVVALEFRIAQSVIDYTVREANYFEKGHIKNDNAQAAIRLAQFFKDDIKKFGSLYNTANEPMRISTTPDFDNVPNGQESQCPAVF